MSATEVDERWVDLHLHTHYSDGADAPDTVVARAKDLGASAIAITDHDTVAGLPEAATACAEAGIAFLSGTEISAMRGKRELHILGLGIDYTSAPLLETLGRMADARATRGRRMVERLNSLGVPVEWDAIRSAAGGVVGRMHLAQAILATGHVRTVQEAFDKFLRAGRPAFVPREVLSARDAVDTIHAAGGLAFVAHPGIGNMEHRLDSVLEVPFDGIEVYHSRHGERQRKRFATLVEQRGLLMSGGSDCHGDAKGEGSLMGNVRVPYSVYTRLCDALS